MAFIPCTLTIEGHGSLLPEERHKIYAPVPGIVAEVLVDHGERVQEGRRPRQARQPGLAERAQGLDRRAGRRPSSQVGSSACRSSKLGARARTTQDMHPDPGPARRGEDHGQERQGADRDRRGTDRVDEHSLAAGRDHHDLGGQEEPAGPAGRDRHRAASDRRDRRRLDPGGRGSRRRHGADPGRQEQARGRHQGGPEEGRRRPCRPTS